MFGRSSFALMVVWKMGDVLSGCIEQQGPHLPVDFDTWFAEMLMVAAAEKVAQDSASAQPEGRGTELYVVNDLKVRRELSVDRLRVKPSGQKNVR